MKNSLGLDDGDCLDGVELIEALEKAFVIHFTNDEAEHLRTVGELYDLIMRKIAPGETGCTCATAMAFYRLRRAISDLRDDKKLKPSADLRFLEKHRAKAGLKQLEMATGLRLPAAEMSWIGGIGCLAVLAAFAGAWYFDALALPWLWSVLLFIGAIYACSRLDPGKLPKDCTTLGGMAQKAAAMNYGRLIIAGASHSEKDIWNVLVELLSVYGLPKNEITRDTVFYDSQLKQAA